jgi:hypothetical protein
MSGKILLECDGCWEHAELFNRSFHDGWDSGELITGDYCPACCDLIYSGQSLPNMRAGYHRSNVAGGE